ncbi:BgTH12-07855, partial [Blumeria graminis f. sp. triticale]
QDLLNIVCSYLDEIEDIYPGLGVDALALILDGVSRAIRGEKIYRTSIVNPVSRVDGSIQKSKTWAAKAAAESHQSKEDKRVMIRLDSKHEGLSQINYREQRASVWTMVYL